MMVVFYNRSFPMADAPAPRKFERPDAAGFFPPIVAALIAAGYRSENLRSQAKLVWEEYVGLVEWARSGADAKEREEREMREAVTAELRRLTAEADGLSESAPRLAERAARSVSAAERAELEAEVAKQKARIVAIQAEKDRLRK
jgi:hypothetical protein